MTSPPGPGSSRPWVQQRRDAEGLKLETSALHSRWSAGVNIAAHSIPAGVLASTLQLTPFPLECSHQHCSSLHFRWSAGVNIAAHSFSGKNLWMRL
ncbi:hypothetical protein ACOMHN_010239 [Nucella lapillus]